MPNRVLRDWTASETIDKLSQGAEIFFTRLIMKADDFGNYSANPKILNSLLFPLKGYSIKTIEKWISECEGIGIVKRYEAEGQFLLSIPNFGQRLRTMTGKFPLPNVSNSPSIDRQLSDNGRPETKRNEVETNQKQKRGDEITLPEFEKLLNEDEQWIEQVQIIHKGKNLKEIIPKAYLHLQAGGRLERGTLADFKQCVQSFLNHEKSENGQFRMKPKSFQL